MAGWSKWHKSDNKDSSATKITPTSDGGTKREIIRSNDGDKQNHSHVWIDRDKNGKVTGAGAEPPKNDRPNRSKK